MDGIYAEISASLGLAEGWVFHLIRRRYNGSVCYFLAFVFGRKNSSEDRDKFLKCNWLRNSLKTSLSSCITDRLGNISSKEVIEIFYALKAESILLDSWHAYSSSESLHG